MLSATADWQVFEWLWLSMCARRHWCVNGGAGRAEQSRAELRRLLTQQSMILGLGVAKEARIASAMQITPCAAASELPVGSVSRCVSQLEGSLAHPPLPGRRPLPSKVAGSRLAESEPGEEPNSVPEKPEIGSCDCHF